ncbi:MAG: glucose-1-phosphate adenylyltransferase [Gammaproteobacteria bacterium]|nr:glucose-1-phosphate adenylyltransferase [Gammaproteobacteria bacterium]
MKQNRILAFVMAGGAGNRLQPLTADRCKPAVPFGSRYRIIDFVLSNLINSGIYTNYLLVQYKSQSLIEHIRKAWAISPLLPSQFVAVVPPQGEHWFNGTADAVWQNLALLEKHRPDMVAVFGADHVYRMDISQMVDFHREHQAHASISALPVPLAQASAFGIIDADKDGRIRAFQEKPANPAPMPGQPSHAYASMGNYLFNTDVLIEALRDAHARGETDFGHHILPRLRQTHRVYAYNFADNKVPGVRSYEEPAYWRDVGTVDAYYDANRNVLGAEPRFDVFNPQWPIYSSNYQGPVARILGGEIVNSLLGAGTLVHEGARIHNTILRREAVVEPGAVVEDCIIMDYVRISRGAHLRRAIIDRHNIIAAGERIGLDHAADQTRYKVTPGGVVVVPRGPTDYYARNTRGAGGSGYAE